MTDEVHDTSRVDAFMAARRRSMLMHAMWKPALAGAAGASLIMLAVWIVLPKVTVREIEVPRVTYSPVDVPQITTRPVEIPVPNVTVHDVPVEIPRIVVAPAPSLTPAQQAFVNSPAYQSTELHGRIVRSVDGRALSFEGGKDFWPAHIDPATGKGVLDPQAAFDAAPFIGDFGMCVQDKTDDLWNCSALHEGREQPIVYKQGRPT